MVSSLPMITEELKKQIRCIDLSVAAARKRQSPRTGLVHLFPNEEASDTIPLYENFCFALALFRQKTAESVTEGKAIIERLLSFQHEGNFPVYLHEYPRCFDFQMAYKVAPVLIYLLRLFGPVLGELKGKVEQALQQALTKRPEKPFWENRYRACSGEPLLEVDSSEFSALEWAEWIITAQLAGETHFALPFDESLQLLLPKTEVQERSEPRPNPIEWLLAEPNFSPRLLRDHPHQILCALLFPITFEPKPVESSTFRLFWKGTGVTHSLAAKSLQFDLPAGVDLSRYPVFEASVFCNTSPETKLFIEGKRATSFQLGETVTIQTPEKTVSIRFELVDGTGDFFGHIFKGNRPTQVACKGVNQYEAYDWHIGLRTLRRSETAQIKVIIS